MEDIISNFDLIEDFNKDMYIWILNPNVSPQSKRFLLSKLIQNNQLTYAEDEGVENAYVINLNSAPSSLTKGQVFWFSPSVANTGPSTITINSLPTKNINRQDGSALGENELKPGNVYPIYYDGSKFRIVITDIQLALQEIRKDYITPEFFGAVGDGATDDGAALQLWADYLANTANPPKGYTAPNKVYLTNQSILFTQFAQIESRGLIKAGLTFPTNTPVLDFSLNTNTYSDVYARVDGANITGVIGQRFTNGGGGGMRIDVTALNCTTGIELRGNYEKTYSKCYVKDCDVGVHVYTFNTASPDELYIYIGGTACLTYFLTDGVDKTSGYVHLNIEGLGDNYVVQQRQGNWTFAGEIRAARGGVLVADDSLLTNFNGLHFIGESNVTEQLKVDTPLATVTGHITIFKGGNGTDGVWIRQALNKGVNLTIDQVSTSNATNAVRIGDSGAGLSVDGAYIRGAFGGNTTALNIDFARFCDIDITNVIAGDIIVGSGSLRNTIRIPHRDRDNVITNNRVAKDNLFLFKGAYIESEMAEILSPIQGYRVESNIDRQGTWDYNEDYSLFLPQGIPTKIIKMTIGDEVTPLVVGATQFTFYLPWEIKLVDVRAEVSVVPTGNDIIVDINRNGVSIFSTPLQIDRSTGTSVSSITPYVLTTLGMVDNSKITVDIDQVGGAVKGAGLKVTLIGY